MYPRESSAFAKLPSVKLPRGYYCLCMEFNKCVVKFPEKSYTFRLSYNILTEQSVPGSSPHKIELREMQENNYPPTAQSLYRSTLHKTLLYIK